ncbi:MAG: 1-deoxy-D-xylulose-5-phosphate synthase N-terminal domain-containing protein [Acutalibacteraceae bacterium]
MSAKASLKAMVYHSSTMFEEMGFTISLVDGHNLDDLIRALKPLKASASRWCCTRSPSRGRGIYAMNSPDRFTACPASMWSPAKRRRLH